MKSKVLFLYFVLFLTIPANSNFNISFEDTMNKWLDYLGLGAEVLSVQRVYDQDGFIDEFELWVKEKPKSNKSVQKKYSRELQTLVGIHLPSESNYTAAEISLVNKDIQDIPYMWSDWIAKLVVSIAVKKITQTLGLQLKIKKIKNDVYQALILPAKGTAVSKYRFNQITLVYSIKNLVLSAVLRIYSSKDYLPLQFVKGELQAILRAIEQGVFPGTMTSSLLASKLSRESLSEYLLHETLGEDELYYNSPEELERILPLKGVEEGQELVF